MLETASMFTSVDVEGVEKENQRVQPGWHTEAIQ